MLNTHKLTEYCAQPQAKILEWNVSKAPLHYDINWENYAISNSKWWTRAILINIGTLPYTCPVPTTYTVIYLQSTLPYTYNLHCPVPPTYTVIPLQPEHLSAIALQLIYFSGINSGVILHYSHYNPGVSVGPHIC